MIWFKKVKTIKDKTGELIFERFAIIQCSFFAFYIHKIYREDRDPFPHNHPWNYISMILWGGYTELLVIEPGVASSKSVMVHRRMFSFSKGDRHCFHRIFQLHRKPTITLFFTFGTWLQWYYLNKEGLLVTNEEFRVVKDNGAVIQTTKQ